MSPHLQPRLSDHRCRVSRGADSLLSLLGDVPALSLMSISGERTSSCLSRSRSTHENRFEMGRKGRILSPSERFIRYAMPASGN